MAIGKLIAEAIEVGVVARREKVSHLTIIDAISHRWNYPVTVSPQQKRSGLRIRIYRCNRFSFPLRWNDCDER